MTRAVASALVSALLAGWLGAGCATTPKSTAEAPDYRMIGPHTMVWRDEFEFWRPPPEWDLVRVEEGNEFSFAFMKRSDCPFPCQSTFAYDEEPFGYSRDLDKRMDEFYRRFLWASKIRFGEVEKKRVEVLGGEGLAATAEGEDPVQGQKVWTKVVMGKRGERVVSFYLTQWRSMKTPFDEKDVQVFDRFVDSFRFLKKSFYQTL